MDKPDIADRKPIKVELEADKEYHWCSCGRSKNQPLCDGSHVGTSFQPLAFSVDKSGENYLCMCKHTADSPFCDGSHSRLPALKDQEQSQADVTSSSAQPNPVPTPEEPKVKEIHDLAKHGLSKVGHHGEMGAMGVPRSELPTWDDIQILPAQFARKPFLDDAAVASELVIGPNAKKPLVMKIPLFVSDMSFGALSEEAKISLSAGAEMAGTGICSGEGGMLPEEKNENSRYLYELASAKFGFEEDLLTDVQAFHFKGGQGAKTGTGGHLPAEKVVGKIAKVRGLDENTPAVSPSTFHDLRSVADFSRFSDRVREITGGIPIGYKISANHIEDDISFAVEAGADYIILDGRGGGTGAAPLIFRDHISVPTIPALARARRHLDYLKRPDITLIITGGLRTAPDFIKAMSLGADGVALANSALQAIGCVGARMCNTNNCPAGIATQKPALRARIDVKNSSERLARYLNASVDLMKVMARACGHDHLNQFNSQDITTWHKIMSDLSGIEYGGIKE